jgi:hypothetical protein
MANSKDVVSPGSQPELVGKPQTCLFQRDFECSILRASQADADRLLGEFGDRFVPLMMDITDADAVNLAAQKFGSMSQRSPASYVLSPNRFLEEGALLL